MLIAAATLAPIYALYVEKIGGDLLDASIAAGIFALAAGITTLISGKYADHLRHSEEVIIVGYLLIGLGFFSTSLPIPFSSYSRFRSLLDWVKRFTPPLSTACIPSISIQEKPERNGERGNR